MWLDSMRADSRGDWTVRGIKSITDQLAGECDCTSTPHKSGTKTKWKKIWPSQVELTLTLEINSLPLSAYFYILIFKYLDTIHNL